MQILQIIGVGLAATVLAIVVRKEKPEMGMLLSLAAGVVIFLFILPQVAQVARLLEELTVRAHVKLFFITGILKIIGIAYLAEFAAQVCRDAGQEAVASKIEMAGKVIILVLAVPILSAVLDLFLKLVL